MNFRIAAAAILLFSTAGCLVQFDPLSCTTCADAEAPFDAGVDGGAPEPDGGEAEHLFAIAIAEGQSERHSCAVVSDHTLRCWGRNHRSQLGISGDEALKPTLVPGLSNVDSVSIGFLHTCAIAAGEIWCFGDNAHGQVGIDSLETMVAAPSRIEGITDAVALSSGVDHSCALREGGEVLCWGALFPDRPYELAPVALEGAPEDVVFIDSGANKIAMLTADGALWIAGEGRDYALGTGTDSDQFLPVQILAGERVRDVDLGVNHSCAVLERGELMCWGQNGARMLGLEDQSTQPTPRSIQRTNIQQVTASFRNSCFLREDGTAACFGEHSSGTLGDGTPFDTEYRAGPVELSLPAAEEIQVYWYHACALYQRTVRCWGQGADGQVGDGSKSSTSFPITVIE